MPIVSCVNGLPVGPSTCAPSATVRAASGMSAVTTTSLAFAFSTIQSSAASAPLETTTWRTIGSRDGRRPPFETKVTTRPWRAATFAASSFTGQASAST